MKRLFHLMIAVDQLLYVILTLGRGNPDETMSAAAWRLERDGKLAGRIFRPLIDRVFWFDKDHCRKAYLAEVRRARQVLSAHVSQ